MICTNLELHWVAKKMVKDSSDMEGPEPVKKRAPIEYEEIITEAEETGSGPKASSVKKKTKKKVTKRKTVKKRPARRRRGSRRSSVVEKEEKRWGDNPKSFMEHLADLKVHILRMVVAVGTIFVFTFSFGIEWTEFMGLRFPFPWPTLENNISTLFFLRIKHDLLPADVQLITLSPIDAMLVNLQISLFLGVSIGMIFIVKELTAFISPALKTKEKVAIKKGVWPAVILFISGCLFSYLFITPFTLSFLYSFANSMGVEKLLSIAEFINFVLILILGFGLIFEMPVIMVAIAMTGIIEPEFYKKHWRIAVVIMIIIAGIITPDTTGITQMVVVIPMTVLYVAGYFVSKRIVSKRNERFKTGTRRKPRPKGKIAQH